MENYRYAPVLITALHRYTHFVKCIESLKLCTGAINTILFIAVDFPSEKKHYEGNKKIKEYIKNISGFKKVIILNRFVNYGAEKNFLESVKEVFINHERLIFSEDDNVFSPNFLEYINGGLIKFNDDLNVFSVCGYKHMIDLPDNNGSNYYFYQGFSAWGFGIWKHKYQELKYSTKQLTEFIINKDNVRNLNKISGRHYSNVLEAILKNKSRYGDFVVFLNNIKNKQYCVFPTVSKVRNLGHDGTGVNCLARDYLRFSNQTLDQDVFFKYENSFPYDLKIINNRYLKYFSLSLRGKIKYNFIRIMFFLKLKIKQKI